MSSHTETTTSGQDDQDYNQWKQYYSKLSVARIDIRQNGIVSLLSEKHHGINSIELDPYFHCEDEDDQFDWEAAGRSIGSSHHVKYLSLRIPSEGDYHSQVISFCRELALNRSIEYLELTVEDRKEPRTLDSDEVFQVLMPFFQNNSNLFYFRVRYSGSHLGLIAAFGACQSLRGASLMRFSRGHNVYSRGDDPITPLEEELVRMLLTQHPLCQITIWGNLIGENSLTHMKSMLSDPHCELKSLTMTGAGFNPSPAVISSIAEGLDGNNSIKCIECNQKHAHLLLDLKSPNFSLEKLSLNSYHGKGVHSKLAVSLKDLHALKSLDLSHTHVKPEVLTSIFQAVLTPQSTLEELLLGYCSPGLNNTSLWVLGVCMEANKSLKTLDLSGSDSVTAIGWKNFFIQLRKSHVPPPIKHIDLHRNKQVDDEVLQELIYFLEKSGVKVVNLEGCSVSSDGWSSLVEMAHVPSVEKIGGISVSGVGEDAVDEHVSYAKYCQLVVSGQLKIANFTDVSSAQSRGLFDLCAGQDSNLEELHLFLCQFESRQDLVQTVSYWIELLRKNSTLTSFSVGCQLPEQIPSIGLWSKFSRVLCNKDTIDATYSSNHSIQELDFDCKISHEQDDESDDDDNEIADDFAHEAYNMPVEIYSLLQMNKDADKAAVARRKVLRVHFSGASVVQKVDEMKLGQKAMPHFLSWVGRESTELSIMHYLLCGMPSLFESVAAEPKRKRKSH